MRYKNHEDKTICIYCSNKRRLNQRTCKLCHSSYVKKWRISHPLNKEQKIKSIARSYAKVYLKRSKIKPQDFCNICLRKDIKLEMHHEDYSKPIDVIFLCRSCHLKIHSDLKIISLS